VVDGEIREVDMTTKLVALWGTPNDAAAFEKHYEQTHIPLVANLPGIRGAVASKALNGPYYRMAELLFDDDDALQSALSSNEGAQLLADSGILQESFGATVDILVVEELARL
jgi:uncharacterized protein (TIGR02118 family)